MSFKLTPVRMHYLNVNKYEREVSPLLLMRVVSECYNEIINLFLNQLRLYNCNNQLFSYL